MNGIITNPIGAGTIEEKSLQVKIGTQYITTAGYTAVSVFQYQKQSYYAFYCADPAFSSLWSLVYYDGVSSAVQVEGDWLKTINLVEDATGGHGMQVVAKTGGSQQAKVYCFYAG